MRLEILQVPGCPNIALLEQRLAQALAGHPVAVERAHRVVDDLATAQALGMTRSPTLLVDGLAPSPSRSSRRACPAGSTAMPTAGPAARPGQRAPFGHLHDTDSGRGSVFDVCNGVRHHLLLFEGPTPDPRRTGTRLLPCCVTTPSRSASTTCPRRKHPCTPTTG